MLKTHVNFSQLFFQHVIFRPEPFEFFATFRTALVWTGETFFKFVQLNGNVYILSVFMSENFLS